MELPIPQSVLDAVQDLITAYDAPPEESPTVTVPRSSLRIVIKAFQPNQDA